MLTPLTLQRVLWQVMLHEHEIVFTWLAAVPLFIKVEQKFLQPIMALHGWRNKNGDKQMADDERMETPKEGMIRSRSSQALKANSGRHTQTFEERRPKNCS